jgi:glycosyltransferase involved in cell wall biosynthesis
MKISYAITVCNEIEEIKRLVSFLLEHKREEDEIVVQQDITELNEEIYEYLFKQDVENNLIFRTHHLQNDFAQFKNNLTRYCSGDYIFQIDADEVPNETLINALPAILENNDFDICLVPRVNTVEGLTEAHIQKWGWRVNEHGWVNWPDKQWRLYRNSKEIKWENKVHERLVGFKTYTTLPEVLEMSLFHHKTIARQEKQNEFYEKL